jgi:POT family proton-dependent oligopeptide transporter
MSQTPLDYFETVEETGPILQQSGHPTATWFLAGSRLFERFSYYGTRGLFASYMIKSLNIDQGETAVTYGFILALGYLLLIPGGLLGDFVLGSRKAMVLGLSLSSLGCMALAWMPGLSGFYAGAGMFLVGSGLYGPNFLAQYAKNYRSHLGRMDAGVYILFFCVNLGAFLGPSLVGWSARLWSYPIGFAMCGCAGLVSLVVLLFSARDTSPQSDSLQTVSGNKPDWVFVCLVSSVVVVFWPVFESFRGELDAVRMGHYIPIFLNSGLLVTMGFLIASIAFGYTKLDDKLKGAAGFGLLGLGVCIFFLSVAFQAISKGESAILSRPVSLSLMGLFVLSELLISPLVVLVLAKNIPQKYLGLAMGLMASLSYLSYRLAAFLEAISTAYGLSWYIGIAALTTLGIAILFFMLWNRGRNGIKE